MVDQHAWQAAGWIASAFFLAGGINQVMRLVDRFKGNPPAEQLQINAQELARRVTALEESTTEASHQRRVMYEKVGSMKDEIRDEVKRDLGLVYDRLNKLSEGMAGLHRDTEHQTRELAHMNAKLDRLIERV